MKNVFSIFSVIFFLFFSIQKINSSNEYLASKLDVSALEFIYFSNKTKYMWIGYSFGCKKCGPTSAQILNAPWRPKENCCGTAIPPPRILFSLICPRQFFSCFHPKFTRFWLPTGRPFFSHLILIFIPQFHSMRNLAIISCKLAIWVSLS